MYLNELYILNYRNIGEAHLSLARKINCFVGENGMGKTNLLDAIYMLSFTKSSLASQDALCITHGQNMALVKGSYIDEENTTTNDTGDEQIQISCGLQAGRKKQFRRGQKDYKRLIDHIGLIPLVMVSPRDQELISDGSEERRRFLDSVISQYDRPYLEHLTEYQANLKQRNALLKMLADREMNEADSTVLDILEEKMSLHGEYIYTKRKEFIGEFVPYFNDIYQHISGGREKVSVEYSSQLHDRDLQQSLAATRKRDIILGWTSQGIHKDDITMLIEEYQLRQVGSQGQQKSFLVALKLSEACFLASKQVSAHRKPILLLDDIFDKLDATRVENIISMVNSERFGQIFITDTDRQHIVELVKKQDDSRVFVVEEGIVKE